MDINELESFKMSDAVKFHKELNPRLWQDEKLDKEVRDQLLLIAEDFVEYLGISNLKVKDVTISGSNAAYSYTPHSDLDLHILVDFNELPNNEVYQELFTAKKTLYNDAHDITVHGVPVELYVQDTNQPVQSLGEYSIVHDKWIRIPKKRRANFDEAATKAKYEKLGDLIELALKSKDPKRVSDTIALVKRYRKSGLDKHGEFGPENLAYKAVRKQGLVQALYDLKSELHAEKLSIEEASSREDAILKIKKLQNTQGRTPAEKENIKRIISKMITQWNIDPNEIGVRQPVDPLKAKIAKAAYEKTAAADLFKQEWNRFKQGIFAEDGVLDKPEMSVPALAKKHGVSVDVIKKQLAKGIEVELEHTSKRDAAREIALNHLEEDPKYYDKLAKVDLEEEQLDETTHESQLINLISKRAAEEIFKMLRKKESTLANLIAPDMKRDKLKFWGISAEKLGVPYVNDPVLGPVLHHAKFRAADYVDSINRKRIASYDPSTHDITVHYPAIVRAAKDLDYETQEFLAKVIAHELQHAVDNFKSKGKTFDTKKTSYATLPYEINARFQEALMNITLAFDDAKKKGRVPDRKNLPAFIDSTFKHNNISEFLPKDGKRYKRLVARAYKFFDAELNNPKKEQPLSIVKRAMNYILEKPTSSVNEASGYIPSEKEKNDPRFKTALTVDVKPDSIKKNAKAFNWKTSRAGIPPQARPDGKINEALISYTPDKNFVSENEEIQYVANTVKDWRVRHLIFETIAARKINESVNNQDVRMRVMKALGSFSSKNLKIGNKYIPVQINILRDSLLFYDVSGNTPAKEPAKFGTLVELSKDEAKIKIDDQLYNYPIHIDSANVMMITVFLDSTEKYDQFRMMVSLEFEQTLPPVESAKDLAENLMKEWKSFLAEDQEQQELFPGYDEKHRQERLNAWLAKSQAVTANYKPKVLYHATTKHFDQFRAQNKGFASALGMTFEVDRSGIFLAENPKFAAEYIEDEYGAYKENAVIIPVYLSAQYTFDLTDNGLSPMLNDEALVEEFKEHDIDLRSIYYHIYEDQRWELFDGPEGEEFVANLKKLGYDSAYMYESSKHLGRNAVWVAFEPSQVKAITNRGSFSPDDPRLMKENG